MDGLEAVEIKLSELEFTRRIDSEYYRKVFLKDENLLLSNKHSNLKDVCKFLIGPFGSAFTTDNYTEDTTYRYIRGKDVKPFVLQDNDNVFMPKSDFERLQKYALKENDILISVVGTLGNSAIINSDNLPAIFSCKSTVIRDSKVNPFFLLTYLNTTIIKDLLLRKTRGAVQLGLNLDDLKTILIVDFSKQFQSKIELLYAESKKQLETSKSLYSAAETLLLSHLGLANYTPNPYGIAVKSFSKSFGISGRLDSEYYQPKYEKIVKTIEAINPRKIEDIISYPVSSGITPKAGGDDYTDEMNGIPFVRAVDINNSCVDLLQCNYIKLNVHNGILKRTQLKRNDVLFSIAGTVGRCGLYQYNIAANINQAVAILRFDESIVKRLYLICFFNSSIGKQYIEKYSRQGLQTNLNLQEVSQLKIPVLDMPIQEQISERIQQSFALRKKSAELLELAKTAVGVAIEQGEDKAMAMLEGVCNDG